MKIKSKIITALIIATIVILSIFCAGCTDNSSNDSPSNVTTSTQTVTENETFKDYAGNWSVTESDGKIVKIHIEKDGSGYVEMSKDNVSAKVTMKCYKSSSSDSVLMYGITMTKNINGKITESVVNKELGRFTLSDDKLNVITDGEIQIFSK